MPRFHPRNTLFLLIVVVAVFLDLSTKEMAQRTLATETGTWSHYVHVDIRPQDHGLTVEQWARQRLGADPENPVEARVFRSIYQVDTTGAGRPPMRLQPHVVLDQRVEVVQLRYRAVSIIDGFWAHSYARNPGAAFSFLAGASEYVRRPFFIGMSILAVLVVLSLLRRVREDQKALVVALACVVGGAIGNLVDRIRYGYVIDFIDWYIRTENGEKHWPTFNVADVFICIGVGLLLFLILTGRADFEGDEQEAEPAPAPLARAEDDDGADLVLGEAEPTPAPTPRPSGDDGEGDPAGARSPVPA